LTSIIADFYLVLRRTHQIGALVFSRLRWIGSLLGLSQLFIFALIVLAIVEPNVWGYRIGTWYTAPKSAPPSDAVIVLGGSTQERIRTGLLLYKSGIAPRIAITGHNPDNPDDWETQELMQAIALANVPATDILWLPSTSTFDDGQRIAATVRSLGWQRIIIVSHWYHGRRAVCSVRYALADASVEVAFTPAATDINLANWWQSENGTAKVFTESLKLLYYSVVYPVPLGGCWSEGMNPIKVVVFSGLGIPLSFMLVVAIRWYALITKKLDIPNGRSSHAVPTPRGGGIAIVIVTVLLLLLSVASGADMSLSRTVAFVVTAVSVAGVSLVDDWWKVLSAKLRLALHFAVALVFVLVIGTLSEAYLPILGVFKLNLIFGGALTMLWITGLINVYNFMDGSDGLAGTQSFLAGCAWALLFFIEGQETLAILSGLLATASLGFLFLNVPPAKIFMGDVGSTFLGFSLSALVVVAYAEMDNSRLPVTGALMVGVFVFDAVFTILRRARKGENLLEAHCSHLYQRLIRLGYSHAAVCARYAVLMALSATGSLMYYFTSSDVLAFAVLVSLMTLYLGLAGWVTRLEADHTLGSKPRLRLIHSRRLETDR
jgi:UDP-N-acetylmuramyl pentapeptide phosphotransferase/UDP-N-acetylglucosamine-1-phosphate transferase/uncharacterized SAM-binding protein YcdF (DUF218 family)